MQEMVKSQKIYSEEEKQAHDTRVKAMNVEDKLKRRSTNIFNSMAQLHRNHAKVISIYSKDLFLINKLVLIWFTLIKWVHS